MKVQNRQEIKIVRSPVCSVAHDLNCDEAGRPGEVASSDRPRYRDQPCMAAVWAACLVANRLIRPEEGDSGPIRERYLATRRLRIEQRRQHALISRHLRHRVQSFTELLGTPIQPSTLKLMSAVIATT
jgi:hypothetical protein